MNKNILLGIVLFIVSIPSLMAVESSDTSRFEYYKKQYAKLHDNYISSPNDIATIADLAYFYSAADNPMRNLPLAMDYIQQSEKKYRDLIGDKSKYKEVNQLIKKGFTIVSLRQQKQYITDEARKYVKKDLSTSEIDAFMRAFANDPVIIKELSVQRSENKYKKTIQLNTEKAYKEYLSEVSNTLNRSDIIDRLAKLLTNKLSFAQTETEVDTMLLGYTEPKILQLGTNRKSEIAYNNALKINTIDNYRNFLSRYPSSNKYDIVLSIMDTLVNNKFKKLKTPKDFCDFALKNSELSQSEQAIDSLVKMIIVDKNNEALRLYLTNFQTDENYNEVYKSYYNRFADEGNLHPIQNFKQQNPNFPLMFLVDNDLKIASNIENINLSGTFSASNTYAYGELLKENMEKGIAFVILQRMIQPLISKNRWKDAVTLMDKYDICFEDHNSEDFETLRALLLSKSKSSVTQFLALPQISIFNAQNKNNTLFFTQIDKQGCQAMETKMAKGKNTKTEATPIVFENQENKNLQFFNLSISGKQMLIGKNGNIYIAKKENTTWKVEDIDAKLLNTEFYEGDASITPDGMGILFISDRPDGYNVNTSGQNFHGDTALASDIYYIPKINNTWGKPINLGKNVNSEFSERSPILSRDLTTLYFTSDRRGGLGYYDIYMSTRTNIHSWTNWSTPINISKTANSGFSEPCVSLSDDEKTLYFSSNKNNHQNYIIYKYPTNHVKKTFFKTININCSELQQIIDANISVTDAINDIQIHNYQISPEKETLSFEVFQSKEYIIELSAEKYFSPLIFVAPNETDFSPKAYPITEIISNKTHIPMPSLCFVEKTEQLQNISLNEIKHLANFLKNNPTIKIEIINNIDIANVTNSYTATMNRSNEIKNQLVAQGIDAKRIIASAYGNLNFKENPNTPEVEIIFFE